MGELHTQAAIVALPRGQHTQAGAVVGRPDLEHVCIFPASFAQQRLWILDQLDPGNPAYMTPVFLRVSGPVDLDVLERSLQVLVQRHEGLRTTFAELSQQVVQVIAPTAVVPLVLIDLEALPSDERQARLAELAREEAHRSFDLVRGPLFRATLLRLSADDHALLLTLHHSIFDGWSEGVLIRDLGAIYEALRDGRSPAEALPELHVQYPDYARWQQDMLQGALLEQELGYWRQQLAGSPPALDLPSDRPRPATQTFNGARHTFTLSAELTRQLRALSREQRSSLFSTLLAAFQTLLFRYTGQTDLMVGTPVANRPSPQVEDLIGCFVNTLVLRSDLTGDPSFRELSRRVREMLFDAFEHQSLPFERLVEELRPERDLSRPPLFQILFGLQNAPRPNFRFGGLTLSYLEFEDQTAKFDLYLGLAETDNGLLGWFEYNSDLFDAATIRRMEGHFRCLLAGIVADPDSRLSRLPLMTAAEQTQMLERWNATGAALPLDQGVAQLFEAQVARTPDALAVVDGEHYLTYEELNGRANLLARRLVEHGVGPDTLVALLDERGTDLLTAMLAVFKAGGAYLPLDPLYPALRLAQILRQSRVRWVLTAAAFQPVLAEALAALGADAPQLLVLDERELAAGSAENLPARSHGDQLAYVIYTSGSTGAPKGAMVAQRGMVNHLYAKIRDLELTLEDQVAQTASQCFDISVWQFFAALVVGGCVHIYANEIAHDPTQLVQRIDEDGITIVETVPSLMRVVLDEAERGATPPTLAQVRWMIPTGEALPPDLARRWLGQYPAIPLLNAYGPTECSDDVTHQVIREQPAQDVAYMPIGRPVVNMQMYVLDRFLNPVPVGVPGELFVGGSGVGRGYLGDPGRTAAVFVPDPFSGRVGARLYKTGDLVRYRPDGAIEFLSRIDHQVKLRGFRIELGEIEAVVKQHPSVQDAVVLVREDTPGQQRLVAYVVGRNQDADGDAAPVAGLGATLRDFLAQRLPEYMVPSAFVTLDALPLTSNGKIDRKALPVPDASSMAQSAYVAPSNEIESLMAEIWGVVLKQEQVSVKANFFELGGHSLLATQVISRVRDALQITLPLRTLFEHPTIVEFAALLEQTLLAELEQLSDEEAERLAAATN